MKIMKTNQCHRLIRSMMGAYDRLDADKLRRRSSREMKEDGKPFSEVGSHLKQRVWLSSLQNQNDWEE